MSASYSRQGPTVCQLCKFLCRQSSLREPWKRSHVSRSNIRTYSASPTPRPDLSTVRYFSTTPSRKAERQPSSGRLPSKDIGKPPGHGASVVDPELRAVERMFDVIVSSKTPPSEEDVNYFLRYCEDYTSKLIDGSYSTSAGLKSGASMSEMLFLKADDPDSGYNPITKGHRRDQQSIKRIIDTISDLAYQVLVHPTVFISLKILTSYVNLQSNLSKPESFPEIFALYATKPIPQLPSRSSTSTEIQYTQPNPKSPAFAIPAPLAQKALDSAISCKSLPMALAIIDATIAAPSYRRAKFIRRGLPPLIGFALVPAASYAVATQLADYQQTMDPAMATNIAFAGIFAYVAFTATIGVVAVTTANDQMVRVVWASGMPLRERWMREEERAALDKVAQAWGFKEVSRRGEEEGEAWESLREWIGLRGMVLDKVELMEGME